MWFFMFRLLAFLLLTLPQNFASEAEEISEELASKFAQKALKRKKERLETKGSFMHVLASTDDIENYLQMRCESAGIDPDEEITFSASAIEEPNAKKRPTVYGILHGHTLSNNYTWLENSKKRQKFLKKEYDYAESLISLQDERELSTKLSDFTPEKNQSYPMKDGNYLYYQKHKDGHLHPVNYRYNLATKTEEVLLDENKLAKKIAAKSPYFHLGFLVNSDDEQLIAYSTDCLGNSAFTIHFQNIQTKQVLEDKLENTAPNFYFNKNSTGVYYLMLDSEYTPKKVMYHALGTDQHEDICLHDEQNPNFTARLALSCDSSHIIAASGDHESENIFLINNSAARPQAILFSHPSTELGVSKIDILENAIYFRPNCEKSDGALLKIITGSTSLDEKKTIIKKQKGKFLSEFLLYNDHIAVLFMQNAKKEISIYSRDSADHITTLSFEEFGGPAYTLDFSYTSPNDKFLQFSYSSPTTPDTLLEFEFSTGAVFKRDTSILADFSPKDYKTDQISITSHDGTDVPVSLFYKDNNTNFSPQRPLYVSAYGAYGVDHLMDYSALRSVLADMNFVIAHVHARGGNECGVKWHKSGKRLKKINTFKDTVSAIQALHARGIGSPENTVFYGGSAGSTIGGYIANSHPDLVKLIISENGFLDVLKSLATKDTLASTDYSEFGSPIESEEDFKNIQTYSPVDNVKEQAYPHMLFLTSVADTNVPCSNSLKMAQEVRSKRTDNGTTACFIDFHGSHSKGSEENDITFESCQLETIKRIVLA